jgi:hypothetical protein
MISKTKIKTKLIATMVAIFMLFSNIGVAVTSIFRLKNGKDVLEAYSNSVALNNSNFENPSIGSKTTLPASPSSWTSIDKSGDVTSGVITLDRSIYDKYDEVLKNNCKLEQAPKYEQEYMLDSQVLMINAGKSNASSGYKSSAISMNKSSYYVISFRAYTEQNATASAKLSSSDAFKDDLAQDANTIKITTNASWKTYKLYVKTNSLTSLTANLELWLGSQNGSQSMGAVFFDNVTVTCYDNSTFTKMFKLEDLEQCKYINLDKQEINDFVKNADFENDFGEDNWKLIKSSNLKSTNETVNGKINLNNYNKTDIKIDDDIKNTNQYNNTSALLINNLKSGYVGYESDYFTINEKSLYKLSFLAKTGNLDGSATVKLVERNPYTNEFLSDGVTKNPYYYKNSSYEAQTFTISSISTSGYSNEATNNWKEYSFYIKGNSLINTEVNLELWLGTSETSAKGYVLFDHFTLTKLTSEEYSSNLSNGTEANLNKSTTATDFANGTFNLFDVESVDSTYPYKPESWTLTTESTKASVVNGIVNTYNNNTSLGIPTIPAINESYPNNNVLMIGNLTKNSQKYTSSSLSLTANSYAKITVAVLTTELNNATASIRLVNGTSVIGEVANINTNGSWQTYTILIRTSYSTPSVSLELGLGQNGQGTGYAFFDNVIYTSNLSESAWAEDTQSKKIDLTTCDWDNIESKSTQINGVYSPFDWTAKNSGSTDTGSVTAGVINSAKYGTVDGFNESRLDGPNKIGGTSNNVLMIKATDDVYYSYSSNIQTEFSSGNYYQIDVGVKTVALAQDENNIVYKDKSKKTAYPFGAGIKLDNIDAEFSGINTNGEWKTYTIYINCTASNNSTITLSLGNKNALTKGVVYFSTLSIKNIDEDTYSTGVSKLENNADIDNILAIGNTDVKNDDNNSTDSDTSFNWLLIPSLITGLAILVAIICMIYRHIVKKAPKKPKFNKPYSKENMKKLADSHADELHMIAKQKIELTKKQNNKAVELNNARRAKSDSVAKLEAEYLEIGKKLENLEKQKTEANQKYKQKVAELKEQKKVETSKR